MRLALFLLFCTFACGCWCSVVSGSLRVRGSDFAHSSASYREEEGYLHFFVSYNATLRPTDTVQLVLNDHALSMQPTENSLNVWEVKVSLPLTHMGAILSHSCQRFHFQTDSKEVGQRERRIPDTDYLHTTCNRTETESDSMSTLFASAVLYTILVGYLYL
eukprot:TRINITY_DN1122_c0_g1_i2.p1 TRINITY_DN1122_c0_g1~~TRINITY_DN1122_c0_g1_i2.p1  ORF type:complete len:161 (-),score=17.07 TRINITY_DN1122_c0_g1_i2:147-629(-)